MVAIISIILTTVIPTIEGYARTTRMNLKGSYDIKEEAVYLDWDTPNQSEPYTYQVFSKKPHEEEFQSISASNLDLDKVVKALNVFPVNHVQTNGSNYIPKKGTDEVDLAGKPLYRSAMLKEWIGEFGHGKIEVDAINQNDFDADPDKYLRDEDGNYKYDVVAVGFWNINQGQNHFLGDNGMKHLREFTESGRGIMTGHHHIALRELDKGMNKLKDLFGIKFVGEDGWNQRRDTYYDAPVPMDYTSPERSVSPHNSRFWATGNEVVASKRGLLLEYPNYVAQEGRVFKIPTTHNGGDYVTGDVWLEFTNPMSYRAGVPLENPEQLPDGTRGSTNSYLSTFNNTALIQTGHSSLSGGHLYSTEDEKMLVANTIFYLAQLTQDTELVDRSAMDIYPPYFVNDNVNVIRTDSNIRVSYSDAIDPTKEFEYYVKAIGQDTGVELQSETIKVQQTSGVVGYSYVMDNHPETIPDNKVDTTSRTITIPNNRNQGEYLHISAVDGVGNVSEPLHIDLTDSYYQVEGNIFMDEDEDGIKNGEDSWITYHEVSLVDASGRPFLDINNQPYKTTTDSKGYYNFGVFTGARLRLKVAPIENRRITNVPRNVSGNRVYNQVTNPESRLTDIFNISDSRQQISRYAGFTYKDLYYNVEHINIDTGNKITETAHGKLEGTGIRERTLRPLTSSQIPRGYSFNNRYRVENGSIRSGNSFNLNFNDYREEVTITFYYTFNGTEDTTKRFQGDDDGSPLPVDFYTNAGIHARRGSDGRIISSGMQVNTTGLVETQEAPIAIQSVEIKIDLLDEDNNVLHSELKYVDDDTYLINDEYLNKVKVNSYLGESSTVRRSYGITPYIINLTEENSRKYNMSDAIGGTEEARRMAIEGTDVEFGVNEDSHYLGRWAYSETDLRFWIPHELLGLSTDLYDTSKVNDIEQVKVTIDTRVYNIMEHQYEPRVGADGLEYYEYEGTELKQGYYQQDSEGNNTGVVRGNTGTIRQTTYLDVSEIKVGQYINSEGFNVENGEIKTVQNKVATEKFDDGGQTVVNGTTVINREEERESAIQGVNEEGNYETKPSEEQLIVNYYEEFGYIPHHVGDELATQQAVPVGGKFYYINPYEYTLMPSYTNTRLSELSGFHFDDPPRNHYEFLHEGKFAISEVEYDSRGSGFYVSDVDEVEEYKSQFTPITEQNKNTMGEVLQIEKEFKNYNINRTSRYEEYRNNNESSGYIPTNEIQGDSGLAYRLPVTYVHNIMEFILEDVVAVGKDTGYPVKSNSETIEEDYKERYIEDNGQEPSETDKLVTMNKGSIYLIPTNKPSQTLEDEYRTRLFINNMGISQTSLVQDNTLSIGKYLYGRGDNTLYSGTRAQVDVGGSFETDQMLGKDLQPIELNYMNGTRLNIGEELADELLKVE